MKARIEDRLETDDGVFDSLDLRDASSTSIVDNETGWPAVGKLSLDGFSYERISGGPSDAIKRLEWLGRQVPFRRQPYRQLARVLKDTGDDKGWRLVCIEMELRGRERGGWKAWPVSFLLRSTIGYGYHSEKAILGLGILIVAGFGEYWLGYRAGSMVPVQQDAYCFFVRNGEPPPSYEHFHALAYSLENSFPLVKMGIQEKWAPAQVENTPKPSKQALQWLVPVVSPTSVRWFRWLQICAGWVLTTLFVGGVTGLVRKD